MKHYLPASNIEFVLNEDGSMDLIDLTEARPEHRTLIGLSAGTVRGIVARASTRQAGRGKK